jgi:Fe-S cluster biosynthesis and repair protein YggX
LKWNIPTTAASKEFFLINQSGEIKIEAMDTKTIKLLKKEIDEFLEKENPST